MRPYHRWTTADLRKLQAMADAGQTKQEAAATLGIPVAKVANACQRHGVRFTDMRSPDAQHRAEMRRRQSFDHPSPPGENPND